MPGMGTNDILAENGFGNLILTVRGERVILDADLARLYGVETRSLNQATRRNQERFPPAFMFQLALDELENLRSQNVISSLETMSTSGKHGGRRTLPFAFTEHGVLMAANVLKSPRAIQMSIRIIEAFVRLRSAVLSVPDLARRIEAVEARLVDHDEQFKVFHEIILPLLTAATPLPAPRRKVGFTKR